MNHSRALAPVVAAHLCALATVAHGQDIPAALNELAATPPQKGIAATVGVICPSGRITSPDLQRRCTEVVVEALGLGTGDTEGARAGLQAMAAEEDAVIGSLEVDADRGHQGAIASRTDALRGAGRALASLDLSVDGAALASLRGGPARGAAAGGTPGLGVFANVSFSTGDRDTTARESGFDFDVLSLIAGADYMPTSTAVLGAALGYASSSADIDANGGDIDTDVFSILGYASWFPTANAYVDATVSYSVSDHEQERAVRYTLGATRVDQVALSSTDSTEIALAVQGGYDWFHDRTTVGVYARLDYSYTDIDGFQERMSDPGAAGNGLALAIDEQDFTTLPLTVGARIVRSYAAGGTTWFPEVYAQYSHEFANDNDPVTGRFVADPTNTRFALPTDEPDRDYFTVGVRASALIGDGGSAYLLYETLLGHSELSSHTIEAGLKLRF